MASHSSPFNRQRQSTKSLDPTGLTAKFLYTILKQLDLKNIDWNEVASGLDITNGHAARMRWSRFRAQIEGLDNSYSRTGSRKKDGERKRKKNRDEELVQSQGKRGAYDVKRMKLEDVPGEGYGFQHDDLFTAQDETGASMSVIDGVTVHHPAVTTIPFYQDRSMVPNSGSVLEENRTVSLKTDTQPTSSMPNTQNTITYKSSVTPKVPPKSHQYLSTAHNQHPYHSSPHLTPYFNAPNLYSNQFQTPSLYANQLQQRYKYGSQPVSCSMQMQQPYMYNMNTSMLAARSANGLANIPYEISLSADSQQPVVNSQKFPSSAQSITRSEQPTVTIPATAYELASDASYPWPYSETSLPGFLQQTVNPKKMTENKNYNLGTQSTPHKVLKDAHGPALNSTAREPPVDVSVKSPNSHIKQNNSEVGTDCRKSVSTDHSLALSVMSKGGSETRKSEQGLETVPVVKIEPGSQCT